MPFVGATNGVPSPGPFRAASWPEPAPSRLQGVRLGSSLGVNREASRRSDFPSGTLSQPAPNGLSGAHEWPQKSQHGFDISQMQYCRSFWAVNFALAILRAGRSLKKPSWQGGWPWLRSVPGWEFEAPKTTSGTASGAGPPV